MSDFLWGICVLGALLLGVLFALIWGEFQYKRGDKAAYSRGYQCGANDQYKGDYKKRLLRHEQRMAAKERNSESPTDPASGSGQVSGSTEPGDRQSSGSESNLFVDPADPGPGAEPGRVE